MEKTEFNTLSGMNLVKEVNKTMEECESARVLNPYFFLQKWVRTHEEFAV